MTAPRFYVACPLGDRTGGPEALALLVASIRARGFEAFLIPMARFRGRKPHPEYDVYDYALADRMPKSSDAHLVLTEVSPIESYRELEQTADSHVWMMWLSVNHSPIPRARYFAANQGSCSFLPPGGDPSSLPANWWPHDDRPLSNGAAKTVREAIRRHRGGGLAAARGIPTEAVSIAYAERVVRRPINFGTQSFYGRGFISTELGRESFMLTDYPRIPRIASQRRDPNLVLYNGAKGRWKIPDLEQRLPNVNFRPIQGMSFTEVAEALSRASLYVEIGNLPGRDRLPREAANFETPTVLLARGAGYCWDDFPLGERYRIPYTEDWADLMAPVIQEALDDPKEIARVQEPFREWVAGERTLYEDSLDSWMERVSSMS